MEDQQMGLMPTQPTTSRSGKNLRNTKYYNLFSEKL